MHIPHPSQDRIVVVKAVLLDILDPSVLTDLEMAWLENHAMDQIIDTMYQTNPMVFAEQESATIH